MLARLTEPEALRAQITAWYAAAEAEVSMLEGDQLLARAPGADLLESVFRRFLGRKYKKRVDGAAIAASAEAPAELRDLFNRFMADGGFEGPAHIADE